MALASQDLGMQLEQNDMINKKNEIQVTICMVTYNQKKFIRKAIESILMQKTNFKFQLLIGDDASTDGTDKIVLEYAKKYPNTIKPIFHKINIGAGNNSLSLYKQINSEYVAICDGDDYWIDENKLQMQYDFLCTHLDYYGIFTKVQVSNVVDSTKTFFLPNNDVLNMYREKDYFSARDLLNYYCVIPVSAMWRWSIKNYSHPLLNFQNLIGDIVIGFIHAKYGKIGFIDKITSCYQRHDLAMWQFNSDKLLISIQNRIKYLNTYILLKNFYEGKEEESFQRNINFIFKECFSNAIELNDKNAVISLISNYYDLYYAYQIENRNIIASLTTNLRLNNNYKGSLLKFFHKIFRR